MLDNGVRENTEVQPTVSGYTELANLRHQADALQDPGTTAHTDVSVIICAYTEARFRELLDAIDSVRRQTAAALEIIVVVDHNPHLLARLQAHVTHVTLTENTHEQGISGARNTGLAAAHGKFVAYLDDDAVADPRWLHQLVTGFANPRVLGVGGFIEPVWGAVRPAWFPEEFLWVVGCSYRGLPVTSMPVRNLIGCNMAFRRQACLDLGGFNTHFGHVGERLHGNDETEFCIRMRQQWPDCVLLYIPTARVRHHVPASRGRWNYFRQRCSLEGISKAALAGVVGAQDGLATERAYTRQVLPVGMLRGCADLILRRDLSGMMRTCAIAVGLMTTATAFVRARVALRIPHWPHPRALARVPIDQTSHS
ncbi:MAG: hypothetical protein PVSMB4_13290 [Ktedonobacterales bacterium]